MNREQLASALLHVQSAAASAARAALAEGADFTVWDDASTLSARHYWGIWKGRMEMIHESPSASPKDFATALPMLERAGEELVHLGRIQTPGRTYLVFLSLSLSRCIACL